jgi:hypothetical protein
LASNQPNLMIVREVERYLLTGDSDSLYSAWPGGFMERAICARDDLRGALIRAVRQSAEGRPQVDLPNKDIGAIVRARVEPMVRGLFPNREQSVVLATVKNSVVFVTGENIEQILVERTFDRSAWTLANLYLASLGVPLLAEDAPNIVGVSEETSCYVSTEYFAVGDPFADFVVHEAAHIFHNCKRTTLGLPATGKKEWLLDIDYWKRETFAYSCEAYARVLDLGRDVAGRRAFAEQYAKTSHIEDERVEAAEVIDIVREAAAVRNGWKMILARCAPVNPTAKQPGINQAVS